MNKASPVYVVLFMVVICAVFGSGIAVMHYATAPVMERNDALIRNRLLCRAFLLAVEGDRAEAYAKALSASVDSLGVEYGGRTWRIFRRRGPAEAADIGFQFSGVGFWDVITGVIVLTPDLSRIVNLQFLKQSETPGLGARIEEPWFTDQFKGLAVGWGEPQDRRVIVGPSPDPSARNRVDAITGATQTSMALQKALNAELAAFRAMYDAKLRAGG